MKRYLIIPAVVAALITSANAQLTPTTKPATPTATSAAPATASAASLDPAIEQLKAKQFREAITSATAYQKTLPATGKVTDIKWANSNSVIAVTYMSLGQIDKAKDPMEAVYRSGKSNRSTILNHAMIDISGKALVVRTLKDLRTFVLAHTDDEMAVNLFGFAIDTATQQFPRLDVKEYKSDLDRANAALEKTKPGFNHWGAQWLSNKDFQEIDKKRRDQQALIDEANPFLTQAKKELSDAQAELTDANRGIVGGSGADARARNDRISAAQRRLDTAKAGTPGWPRRDSNNQIMGKPSVEQAQAYLDGLQKGLPRPNWTVKLEPVEFEMLKS